MSLDTFFQAPKPKETERCSNPKCRKLLRTKENKYTLMIKGEPKDFCRECAKEHLPKPETNKEEENESENREE